MLIDGQFACYILEDEQRTQKVYGETRIPDGIYPVKLRTVGDFHERYSKKFPDMHKGMLWLQDVPAFKYVLIHIGNEDDDTAGCLLTGDRANNNKIADGWVDFSTAAYKRIYPGIARAILSGERVTVELVTLELNKAA